MTAQETKSTSPEDKQVKQKLIAALTERLQESAVAAGFDATISACELEKEPFFNL